MKRVLCILLTALMLLPLTACGRPKEAGCDIFAMDTYMSLVAYGNKADEALTECCQAINHLEELLSRTKEGSDVWNINHGLDTALDPTTVQLLQDSMTLAEETDGTFDITVAPIVELWGISSDTPRVPEQEEIDALLPLVGSEHIRLTDGAVTLDEGCAIDLGGIAKGYASDAVKEIFASYGVQSGTVSLGGNVYVCGTRPDGKLWTVAIQDPENADGYAAYISLSDAFVVTSGGYQRYFTAEDGTVYQHIIDPKSGYPVQSDLVSVSLIGTCGEVCDAYSTALYVMGEADAIDFWRSRKDFDMVLITADGRLLYTPDLTIKQPEGSGYDFQAIA